MRNFIYSISAFVSIIFISCAKDDDTLLLQSADSLNSEEIEELYHYDRQKINALFDEMEERLSCEIARSNYQFPSKNVIGILLSMSHRDVDSLYRSYCTYDTELLYDSCYNLAIDVYTTKISVNEFQKLVNFKNDYVDIEDDKIEYLKAVTLNLPKLTQQCIVYEAAYIDDIKEMSNHFLNEYNKYCLEEAIKRFTDGAIKSAMGDALIDEISSVFTTIPVVDLGIGIMLVSLDLYDMIEGTFEYQLCCRTHLQ